MQQPLRVLLIEDNPADARWIEEMLGDARGLSFELEWVDNLKAGVARLREHPTDVVLLDLGLPESAGLDTLQRLLSHGSAVPTLVVLSGLTEFQYETTQTLPEDFDIVASGQRAIEQRLEVSERSPAVALRPKLGAK